MLGKNLLFLTLFISFSACYQEKYRVQGYKRRQSQEDITINWFSNYCVFCEKNVKDQVTHQLCIHGACIYCKRIFESGLKRYDHLVGDPSSPCIRIPSDVESNIGVESTRLNPSLKVRKVETDPHSLATTH